MVDDLDLITMRLTVYWEIPFDYLNSLPKPIFFTFLLTGEPS